MVQMPMGEMKPMTYLVQDEKATVTCSLPFCQDCDGVAWSGLKSQSQNLFNLNPQHV